MFINLFNLSELLNVLLKFKLRKNVYFLLNIKLCSCFCILRIMRLCDVLMYIV